MSGYRYTAVAANSLLLTCIAYLLAAACTPTPMSLGLGYMLYMLYCLKIESFLYNIDLGFYLFAIRKEIVCMLKETCTERKICTTIADC